MKEKQSSQILFISAGTIVILGAFAKLFEIAYAPYAFAVGVALLIFSHGKQAFDSKHASKNQQRVLRLGFLSSLMLGLAAYFMLVGSNSWVVLVLIYAITSFYLSFRGK